MLDTNAAVGFMNGHAKILAEAKQHSATDICVSSIVAHELFFGAYKGQKTTHNLQRLEKLRFEVLTFDKEDAQEAAEIRVALGAAGTPIGVLDSMIAGHARSRDLILITHNVREFSRVRDLRIEDWENG